MSPTTTSPESNKVTAEAGFTSYPSYKPSGLDWLAEIPESWSAPRLGFVTEVNPPKGSIRDEREDYPVSFIPMEAIGEGGGLDLSSEKPLSEVVDGYTYFEDGDVLVAKITPCFENEKGALPRNLASGVGFGTTELHVLRPGADIDERFLFYLTISDHFRKFGEASMYGAAGQKRVPEEFIFGFRNPLPPLQEQRGIASFLNQSTSRIDRLIDKKERLIELLEERRTALITKAVTKGLDPDVAMKDSGVEWLGKIPEHWEVPRMKYVSELHRGFDLPENERMPGEVPVISSGGIIDKHAVPKVHGPGVITGRYGSIGNVFYTNNDFWPLNTALYVRNFRGNHPRFVYYLLQILPVLAHAVKSAVPGLDRKDIHEERAPMPPKDEQVRIARFLSEHEESLALVRSKIEAVITRLREYRSALITAAVTGKIDVRDQVA